MLTCGECTECCYAFPIEQLNKPPNTQCKHCNNGCEIHDTKPDECSGFNCAYVQSKSNDENLRPDKCGIIFEKYSDNIFLGTVRTDMDVSDAGHRQIRSFLDQGYSVVLYSKHISELNYMICDRHDEDQIRAEFQEIANGYLQH
jgi:hypothetical protein